MEIHEDISCDLFGGRALGLIGLDRGVCANNFFMYGCRESLRDMEWKFVVICYWFLGGLRA